MADTPTNPPATPTPPPEPTPTPPTQPQATGPGFLHRFARAFTTLVVRFYALAILLVVVWAGYTAVAFLARTVFKPAEVPEQYRGWQSALSRGNFALQATPAESLAIARAPVEHYHQVDRALPPDVHNGCLTSGCHTILAHTKHKETRAFANLHATFLSCMMCHDATVSGPMQAVWVDDATGQPAAAAPATLRLTAYLQDQAQALQTDPATVHVQTLGMLAEVTRTTQNPLLEYLQTQINTSEPGSPVWRTSMAQLIEELPNDARGEYGAKLYPKHNVAPSEQRLRDLSRQFRAAAEGSSERSRLYDQIHENVLAKPAACLACHGGEPARLDFTSVGYPAARAAQLRNSSLANLMQQIREGRPFHLPRILENQDGR